MKIIPVKSGAGGYMQISGATRIPVSQERHEMMTRAGFIHVTGLTMIGTGELEGKLIGRMGCNIQESERGTYGLPPGMTIVVTFDRQVWLGRNDIQTGTFATLAPSGPNMEISFKWRPRFNQRDLLCRLADSNWKPDDLPYAPPTTHDIDQLMADLPLPPARKKSDPADKTE